MISWLFHHASGTLVFGLTFLLVGLALCGEELRLSFIMLRVKSTFAHSSVLGPLLGMGLEALGFALIALYGFVLVQEGAIDPFWVVFWLVGSLACVFAGAVIRRRFRSQYEREQALRVLRAKAQSHTGLFHFQRRRPRRASGR